MFVYRANMTTETIKIHPRKCIRLAKKKGFIFFKGKVKSVAKGWKSFIKALTTYFVVAKFLNLSPTDQTQLLFDDSWKGSSWNHPSGMIGGKRFRTMYVFIFVS